MLKLAGQYFTKGHSMRKLNSAKMGHGDFICILFVALMRTPLGLDIQRRRANPQFEGGEDCIYLTKHAQGLP
jgi:hypothetical protein